MARLSFGPACAPLEDWYFEPDVTSGEDFYDSVSPSENIWKKFELLPTPPRSPQRDDDLSDECFMSPAAIPTKPTISEEDWLSTAICFDKSSGLKSKLIQDCMWSGSDEEQARVSRTRKYSLSELTMKTASTSCVDPTSIAAAPRQQNLLEHSYSLTTPEPMRVPVPPTPATTDEDSESEEDVDVVTVDTRIPQVRSTVNSQMIGKPILTSQIKVRHDLRAVADKLNRDAYKRPKCITDHDFCIPSNKKIKMYHSSMQSSVCSSDSEDFEGRRSQHNVMERQRRNELKQSLHGLRDCLPTLSTHEKAPKVVILSHATSYVQDLYKEDQRLMKELRSYQEVNKTLKDRLAELQALYELANI